MKDDIIIVPESYFLEVRNEIIDHLKQTQEPLRKSQDGIKYIHEYVKQEIDQLPNEFGLLAGGGVDSTYLLVLANALGKKVTAISSRTAENYKSLKELDHFCEIHELDHLVFDVPLERYKFQRDTFRRKFKRAPRDPVAPIVNELTLEAKKYGLELLIDGQFADTALFCNPQNNLFNLSSNLPGAQLNMDKNNKYHFKNKKQQLLRYLLMNKTQKILYLCRIQMTKRTQNLVTELLKCFDAKIVLQVIFWDVLLKYREYDKYLNNQIKIISPFNNFDLLHFQFYQNLDVKKYMKLFISSNSEIYVDKIKSMSFRTR